MRAGWGVLAAMWVAAATAWGQTAAERPRAAEPPPGAPTSLNEAFQRSGGSLFRMDHALPQGGLAPPESSSVFAVRPPEPRRIRKHDLITVIIREQSESKSESSSDLKKQMAFNLLLEAYPEIAWGDFALKGKAPPQVRPQLRFGGDRSFKGEGTVERSDTVTARVQAQVIDVRPNGVLIIQATRQIKSDEEEVRIVLTGMVRSEDVTADNSVLSTQVADLMLEKHTTGSARRAQQRGFIPRLVDRINPF
ncbi:MAG: flagellar basal body L-ring protein FlgH [Tepidisphaerales bacterium]